MTEACTCSSIQCPMGHSFHFLCPSKDCDSIRSPNVPRMDTGFLKSSHYISLDIFLEEILIQPWPSSVLFVVSGRKAVVSARLSQSPVCLNFGRTNMGLRGVPDSTCMYTARHRRGHVSRAPHTERHATCHVMATDNEGLISSLCGSSYVSHSFPLGIP